MPAWIRIRPPAAAHRRAPNRPNSTPIAPDQCSAKAGSEGIPPRSGKGAKRPAPSGAALSSLNDRRRTSFCRLVSLWKKRREVARAHRPDRPSHHQQGRESAANKSCARAQAPITLASISEASIGNATMSHHSAWQAKRPCSGANGARRERRVSACAASAVCKASHRSCRQQPKLSAPPSASSARRSPWRD